MMKLFLELFYIRNDFAKYFAKCLNLFILIFCFAHYSIPSTNLLLHFEEAVYFLPLSPQKFLALIYQFQKDERLTLS